MTTPAHECSHCGLPVPIGLIEPSAGQQFCCAGCRAVYHTLHACGLETYYRLRDVAGKPAHPGTSKFESFDTPAFADLYVQPIGDDCSLVDLVLEGVTCAACVWLVEKLPTVLPGVIEARLSLREATVRVTWNHQQISLSQVARTLDSLGYTPHPAKGVVRQDVLRREDRKRIVHLAVAGALAGNTMLLALALYAGRFATMEDQYRMFFRWISAGLGIISLVWPGATFFRGAISAIRLRGVSLDVPIALALLAGGTVGIVNVILNRGEVYFDSLTVLVFLLLVGRFLQFRQQRRADAAVELLFSLAPAMCRMVRDDGTVEELPSQAIKVGDLVEVLSGQVIPADGVIEIGTSSVYLAILTGESIPVAVGVGDNVFGGAQNQGAALRIRVQNVGEQGRVGKLMRIVEHGVSEKPPVVQFADRVGSWFVVIVSLAAVVTFAFWSRFGVELAVNHAVALLIVVCPCALGLTTPVTLAIAIGCLARRNILVKSGAAMELLAGQGNLLLDKTGTLTFGDLRLLFWHGSDELRGPVAMIEQHSQHPIAKAFCASLRLSEISNLKSGIPDMRFQITDVRENRTGGITATLDGKSIAVGSPAFHASIGTIVPEGINQLRVQWEQSGNTVVLIAVDGQVVALAAFGDQVRGDAAGVIANLAKLGWRPRILSGDSAGAVSAVAQHVGIPDAQATGQLAPEQKLNVVREYRNFSSPGTPGEGEIVIMLGDGVNDAAALAAADVGIAAHGGAEVSLAAADVYLAVPGLAPLQELILTSRKTLRTIHRSLLLSLLYNLLAGGIAMTGRMNPLIAAILMPVSSATVLSLAMASSRKPPKLPASLVSAGKGST